MEVVTCLKCGIDYLHEHGLLLCGNCKKDDKMKIISCDRCGVLLNQDNINFPDTTDHDTGELIEKNVAWDDDLNEYVPVVDCPVCGNKIPKEI